MMSDRFAPVTVFCRLIDGRKADSVFVCEKGSSITAWLPRSQVKIEEGGFLSFSSGLPLGQPNRSAGRHPAPFTPGDYLRITLPLWLAEDRGFRTAADARQQRLFGEGDALEEQSQKKRVLL